MNLITKDTDYAIQALAYMANSRDKIVSTKDLNEHLGISRPYLRKLLLMLQKAGFLMSLKGNQGGFQFKQSPEKIMVTEIIELFQGEIKLTNCIFQKRVCPNAGVCTIRKKLKKIESVVKREFKGLTIQKLIEI